MQIKNPQCPANGFLDNKLSTHLREDKTNWFLFSKAKCSSKLNISYGDHDIKQDNIAEYLECHLDSNLSSESITMKVF